MKKFILLNAIVIAAITAFAQNYSQVGAIGHYNIHSTVSPYDRSYATLETVKDTTINSFACQKLEEIQYNFNGTPMFTDYHYIQNDGQVVYFFYLDSNATMMRDTLYDFALNKGDSYTFFDNTYYPVTVTIDSVSSMIINGVNRKVQHLKSNHVGIYLLEEAVEGLGAVYFFMPWGDSDPRGGLRCYQDTTIGFYQDPTRDSCDFISVGLEELKDESSSLIISPNPTKDWININFKNQKEVQIIELLTLDGKILQRLRPKVRTEYSLNVSDLSQGMYIIKVQTESGMASKKWIKQ